MNKLLITALLLLFSSLALAEGNLSFTPPSTDYSVVFLGNLFGIVDGVLSAGGTGSQIMGAMFTVFNSAVLALGGIIIMYTLIVSTMNTAHEGQMLGQKWSSIWIPLRSILGLGLLIPKASGYCLMQIFVMWIVIQGVGAADKVWDAALSYLNRGGLIIQAQGVNPATALLDSATANIATGATNILTGQVCMLALEKQLIAQRQSYLKDTSNGKGSCADSSNNPLKDFCNTPVPDFLSSVNAVDVQNSSLTSTYSVTMPNFSSTFKNYKKLNGICGIITWKAIDHLDTTQSGSNTPQDPIQKQIQDTFSEDEFKTAQMSRAIAIQQMYTDLAAIARVIVNNDPQIGSNEPAPQASTLFASPFAKEQFGVPLNAQGQKCAKYIDNCKSWGPSPSSSSSAVLFNGTEFLNAINDYNGIMKPTLNAIQRAGDVGSDNASRKFITQASAQGWIMAGAYFFDLVKLNTESKTTANTTDTGTGLEGSTGKFSLSVTEYPILATWFEKPASQAIYPRLEQIKTLFTGVGNPAVQMPNLPNADAIKGLALQDSTTGSSSTVFGFINNSAMIQMPDQPGLAPLTFATKIIFSTSGKLWPDIPELNGVGCHWYWGEVYNPIGPNIPAIGCIDDKISNFLYNTFVAGIVNQFSTFIFSAIQATMNAILWLPLQGIAVIFQQGLDLISKPGVNPVVALANMGVWYINFAGNLWENLFIVLLPVGWAPPIIALLMLAMPIVFSWLAVMVAIAFTTAYYIPILPYMMFTFGAIGWLMAVVEAMVAAPLVALGITHPEGHEAFGKGEGAIMILMNIFLRPAMMIIGFIAGIALTYVCVWILNSGYNHAISYIQGPVDKPGWSFYPSQGSGSGQTQYNDWAGLFAFFFSVLTYTSMYVILVQKSFTLISVLPDKVLRWIGGSPEGIGQEAQQWGEEVKSSSKEGGEKSYTAQQQVDKTTAAGAEKGKAWAAEKVSQVKGMMSMKGNTPDATKSPPGGDAPPG